MGMIRAPKVVVLAQSAVQVTHTGDTAEFTFATVTIPAGMMGANGAVYVEALFSMTNNANAKTPFIRFGGTNIAWGFGITGAASAKIGNTVQNRNAVNSQVCLSPSALGPFSSGASSAVQTMAIDTSQAVNITITGQLANAADSINLEAYRVELYPKG